MAGDGGDEIGKKVVFVTVGTTSFDSLIKAIDSDEVREDLLKKGYTHLIIQMGRGLYVPSKVGVVIHHSLIAFGYFFILILPPTIDDSSSISTIC